MQFQCSHHHNTTIHMMDASRVVVFVVPMLALIWIIYTGYMLVTETRSYATELETKDTRYVFMVGALTVVFGLFSFILGLSLVAETALALSEDTKYGIIQEEKKKISQIVVQSFITAISVSMLVWTSYYGYTLASESQKERKLNRLSFLIGVIAMAFGLTNFSIGIAIMADSAIRLSVQLQDNFGETNTDEDDKVNAKLQV